MKILFVKLGAIGDALMARGLPAEAARAFPGAQLHWVAGSSLAPLVRLFPRVDQVLEADDVALLQGGPWSRALAVAKLWSRLSLRSYDLVLTGHSDARYGLLTATTLAGQRRSFSPMPGRFHGHEYIRLLSGEQPQRPASPLPRLKVSLDPALSSKLKGRGPSVLLFPGGAKNLLRDDALRRWPLQHYAALAKLLLKRRWRVWLGGAASDAWVRPAFAGLPVLDLLGQAGLTQTLGLCAAARCVVTHDSGPLHLAQASGARSVALFGPTTPSEKLDPFSRTAVAWGGEELLCRPCYDGRDYAVCGHNTCLDGLLPAKVLPLVLG